MSDTTQITGSRKQNLILLIVCVITLVFFKVFGTYLKTFDRQHISSDVTEYYAFVPAAFECQDLSFKHKCPELFGPLTTPDGHLVNKRSIGMAYMYIPPYAISQLVSSINGDNDNGYSKRTQNVLVLGMWFYALVGLFFLGKALFRFFPPIIVVSTLFLLVGTTNLIWYTNGEPLFTHGVNFMWLSVLIYFTMVYHDRQKLSTLLIIAFSISMLALIRPVNLLLGVFPFIYGVYNKETLQFKVNLIRKNYQQLFVAIIIFILPVIPQLIYWKYATGHWIFYSYQGEKFFWDRPLIFKLLFSFRKGWLIYTPVMILSIVGLWSLRKHLRPMFFTTIFIFLLFLYVISCWWAWSYGGCYGMRPMIDIYPLLAFPIAALLFKKKWWLLAPLSLFIIACTILNIFQVQQYSWGVIHYDQMNFETYRAIWRKRDYPKNHKFLLSYPDYAKELAGKGSYYTLDEITDMEVSIKFLEANFLCASDTAHTGIKANHQYAANCDAFQLKYDASVHKFTIRSCETGKYCRLDETSDFVFIDEPNLLNATRFTVKSLGKNKFCFMDDIGRYIISTPNNKFALKAEGEELSGMAFVVIRKYLR